MEGWTSLGRRQRFFSKIIYFLKYFGRGIRPDLFLNHTHSCFFLSAHSTMDQPAHPTIQRGTYLPTHLLEKEKCYASVRLDDLAAMWKQLLFDQRKNHAMVMMDEVGYRNGNQSVLEILLDFIENDYPDYWPYLKEMRDPKTAAVSKNHRDRMTGLIRNREPEVMCWMPPSIVEGTNRHTKALQKVKDYRAELDLQLANKARAKKLLANASESDTSDCDEEDGGNGEER